MPQDAFGILLMAPTKSGSGSSDGAPPCSCRLVLVPAISGSGVRHARIGPTRERPHPAAEGKADAGRRHGELEDVRVQGEARGVELARARPAAGVAMRDPCSGGTRRRA